MLCKLAWGNVRRAGRDYLVYLLTLTLAVTVFYSFNTIAIQVDVAGIPTEGLADLLGGIISGLTVFLALVMGFLMVYANNFIMKRRKKEFGLYQVLGMSRGQVARIMALETAIVSGGALALGILLGVMFSQLMTFFTASLFKTQIADFHFFFSWTAFLLTVGCLVAIFVVTLLFNLRVVRRAKIIDLMGAERKNEAIKTHNPWLSAAVFIAGAALIGVAYARLLRDGLPIDGGDGGMQAFTLTTVMVVVGTILFFFGLSGFLLKVLQSARGLYWSGLNMFTLRQLSAKVNTVSFSMAVISMILFLALTSVTGGMSIASVMNATLETATPADYSRTVVYYGPSTIERFDGQGSEAPMGLASEPIDIVAASSENVVDSTTGEPVDFDLRSLLSSYVQTNVYDATPLGAEQPLMSLHGLCEATGKPLPKGTNSDEMKTSLMVMPESDYNRYLEFRGQQPVDLGADGYLLTSDMGASVNNIYDAAMEQGVTIPFGSTTLRPAASKVDARYGAFVVSSMGGNAGTIVVPDEVLAQVDLPLYGSFLLGNYAEGVNAEQADEVLQSRQSYGSIIRDGNVEIGSWGMEYTRSEAYEGANTMNGLISYLAIYIGFVLVVACAAILTIQQLSGVADAGKNCLILSELGTSRREIMRSVLAQQTVFFVFPLAVGVAHSLVALDVVIEIVELFGHMAIGSTVGLTCAIFLLCYGGYFVLTYMMSKGIVRDSIRVRHAQ